MFVEKYLLSHGNLVVILKNGEIEGCYTLSCWNEIFKMSRDICTVNSSTYFEVFECRQISNYMQTCFPVWF